MITQEFQVGRQPIPTTGCGNRESPVTNLPTRSREHCDSGLNSEADSSALRQ